MFHHRLAVVSALLVLITTTSMGATNEPLRPLPAGITVTFPDSNPLRDALQPVPKDAIFKMPGYFLWDPSVIEVDGTYHLFASRWPEKEGMKGWFHSHVIHATAPALFGPYTFKAVVLSPDTHPWATQAVHNPKVTKVGSKFLIYHLGIPQWKTGFAYADSIDGPWTPVAKPVIPTNNPALLLRTDGSAYVVGKFKPKATKDGQWDAYMQAFSAPDVNGPYTRVGDAGNRLPADLELEDPSIWWADDRYHVLCTDWEAKVTGVHKALVHYTSTDGIAYELTSRIPVWSQTDPIPLAGGGDFRVSAIERPEVFVNSRQAVSALLVAVRPPVEDKGPSYLVIRPVAETFGR